MFSVTGEETATFLDCVDRTEQLDGHYHVAAVCLAHRFLDNERQPLVNKISIVIVRAGVDQTRVSYTAIRTSLGGQEYLDEFFWQGRRAIEGTVVYTNWAVYGTAPDTIWKNQYDLDLVGLGENEALERFLESVQAGVMSS